jgi:hypothetical protein
MTDDALLRDAFVSLEVNDSFTEAVVGMRDGSELRFRHRVDERWARAEGPGAADGQPAQAGVVLSRVVQFRLNGKHLDVTFQDGSRWEAPFAPFVHHKDTKDTKKDQ